MVKEKEIGRASFSPAEIAERNRVSKETIYRAIKLGRLKTSHLGTGARGCQRVTLQQEQEWLVLCAQEEKANHISK